MQFRRRILAKAALAFVALGSLGNVAFAQGGYPSKPVKVVVAFTAGGPTDLVARMIGQ